MQLIAVDIGNSSIKIAFPSNLMESIDDDRWWSQTIIRRDELIDLELHPEPAFWSISSVNDFHFDRLSGWIKKNRPADVIHPVTHDDVPLNTRVKNPRSVGIDRLMAASMAVQLNDGGGPVVTIDAGTAVTIDIVDHQDTFVGGVIFPGATNNLMQLSESTSALPDLSEPIHLSHLADLSSNPVGDDTIPAIIKGVFATQIAAINSITESICKTWSVPHSSVFMTGGGIVQISEFLNSEWNAIPDLVLRSAKSLGKELLVKGGYSSASLD